MKIIVYGLAVVSMGLASTACQVNKTQEGKMPKVDVKTSGGQMPAYNVEGPDVNVSSKTETIKVPTVQVTTPANKSK